MGNGFVYTFLVLSWGSGIPLLSALLTIEKPRVANRLLGVSLASVLYNQTVVSLMLTGELRAFPLFVGTGIPFLLISVVSLYLYVRALTEPGFHLRPRDIRHAVIPVLGILWYVGVHFTIPSEEVFDRLIAPLSVSKRLAIACLPFAAYLLFCYLRLLKYHRQLPHFYSNLSKVRMRWMQLLITFFFLILLVVSVDTFLYPAEPLTDLAFPVITALFLILGTYALNRSPVLGAEMIGPVSKPGALTPPELNDGQQRLTAYLEEKKSYLDPDLRLVHLADGLGMKPYETSELINRAFGKSFYELINEYRVEEAKRRLLSDEFKHLSILGIASDVGFNSKSSFNEAFKRITGETPSQFRARQN